MQAKPDHLSFVVVQLQPTRRTPLGDFRDTAGQAVSHRLGVSDWAAVVELCVVCVHVRVDVVPVGHGCEVVSVGNETLLPHLNRKEAVKRVDFNSSSRSKCLQVHCRCTANL